MIIGVELEGDATNSDVVGSPIRQNNKIHSMMLVLCSRLITIKFINMKLDVHQFLVFITEILCCEYNLLAVGNGLKFV